MIPESQCGLTQLVQERLLEVFRHYSAIDRIIIYGSRAKGNFKPGSDIDITLVAPKLDLLSLAQIENELDDLLLPYKIDLSLFHSINNPSLVDQINKHGIELN